MKKEFDSMTRIFKFMSKYQNIICLLAELEGTWPTKYINQPEATPCLLNFITEEQREFSPKKQVTT